MKKQFETTDMSGDNDKTAVAGIRPPYLRQIAVTHKTEKMFIRQSRDMNGVEQVFSQVTPDICGCLFYFPVGPFPAVNEPKVFQRAFPFTAGNQESELSGKSDKSESEPARYPACYAEKQLRRGIQERVTKMPCFFPE